MDSKKARRTEHIFRHKFRFFKIVDVVEIVIFHYADGADYRIEKTFAAWHEKPFFRHIAHSFAFGNKSVYVKLEPEGAKRFGVFIKKKGISSVVGNSAYLKGNSVHKSNSEAHSGKHSKEKGKEVSFFRNDKHQKENYRRKNVENTAAKIERHGFKVFFPGRRHHKALAAGSHNVENFKAEFSAFFNEHHASDSERDEFIAGKKSENKVAEFVDYCLDKKRNKNYKQAEKHLHYKICGPAAKKFFRIIGRHKDKTAKRTDD